MQLPEITEEMIRSCIEKTGFQVDEDFLVVYILRGQEQVRDIIQS